METILAGLLKAAGLIFTFNSELYGIVILSFIVSGLATLLASAIGVPLGAVCALKRFPGRSVVVTLLNTFMGLPPVVAGLFIYLMLSRSGPLGFLGLLYSPSAMVIAQTAIAMPIIAALTLSAVTSVDKAVYDTALTLGATAGSARLRMVAEARHGVFAAIIAGLGRTVSEVGAVLIVGGNIAGYTRVMTTAVAMETGKGAFELAIALGIVLLALSFGINALLRLFQGGGNTL